MNQKNHWQIHPAFPQPESNEVKLWRYMDFYKFELLLESNRLVFPRADKLGEPFEGTRPRGDIDWWKRKADEVEQNKDVIKYNSKWMSDTAMYLKDKYFVSCWHINEFENRFMWESYTKSEKSVAIQTTYSILSECTHSSIPTGLVRYIDYSKERLPSMNMFEFIMHKEIYFKDESEVRAVGFSLLASDKWEPHFKANYFELNNKPGFFCYAPEIDVQKMVKAVVLHPSISEDDQNKVSKLCTKYGVIQPKQSRVSKVWQELLFEQR